MTLLAAHPSSHSVAIISNTARNQNPEFIFNHWVCFCIRHISGVIQPVEYYDSRDMARHGCEEMANLLFRYASKNYARFVASAVPVTLSPVDVDALLPLQAESFGIGGIHDFMV